VKFDVKYHIQADNELQKRREANARELDARRRKVSTISSEFDELRAKLASTGSKIAIAFLEGDDTEQKLTRIDEVRAENVAISARIKELLMKAKLPPDYLDTIYSCKTCQDTGVYDYSRCQCYIDTVRRFAGADINVSSSLMLTGFDTFKVDLYPDVEIENRGNVRQIMADILRFCENYAEEFHLPNRGIFLHGGTGLGKTHLSLAIAKKVISNGFNVIYGSAPDLFRKAEQEHFGQRDGNTMDTLQSAELLILDDVGAEFDSRFYTSIFYNLLNTRMNLGRPLIISTNLTIPEFTERYGNRITSRILTMEILQFYGEDIRLLQLT